MNSEQKDIEKEKFPIFLCITMPILNALFSFCLSYIFFYIEIYGFSVLFSMIGTFSLCTAITGFATKRILEKSPF
jgi:hypothetical protein